MDENWKELRAFLLDYIDEQRKLNQSLIEIRDRLEVISHSIDCLVAKGEYYNEWTKD